MISQQQARNIRRFQTIISIIIFSIVFAVCWHNSHFDLRTVQLSHFGVDQPTSWAWNISVFMLSISMCVNVFLYIKHHDRIIRKDLLYAIFGFIFLLLAISGLVDMHHVLHNIAAWTYFFCYPFAIFLMGFINRKTMTYKEWLGHTVLSVIMIVCPLITIGIWKGKAITEVLHSLIAFIWNAWLL